MYAATSITLSTWSHYILTIDEYGNMQLYKDGVKNFNFIYVSQD